MFTQSVAPFSLGELPLQHYNNLLCISHLNEHADSICLHHNDDVLSLIERSANLEARSSTGPKNTLNPLNKKLSAEASASKAVSSVSIFEMNKFIVRSFLSAILPVDTVSHKSQSIGMEYLEMHRFLCSNPALKIIEIYNVNGQLSTETQSRQTIGTCKWNPFLKTFLALLPRYGKGLEPGHHSQEPYISLNSLLIARGQDAASSVLWKDYEMIKRSLNPVEWNPFTVDFWSAKNGVFNSLCDDVNNKKINASLTVCMNRNKCVEYLKEVINKVKYFDFFIHKTTFDLD